MASSVFHDRLVELIAQRNELQPKHGVAAMHSEMERQHALPGQVEEEQLPPHALAAAISFMLSPEGLLSTWTDEDLRGKGDTVTLSIAQFSWDEEIQNKHDLHIFTRDVVNTDEFRTAAAEKLSKQTSRFCTVHCLEHDMEVSAGGKVVMDTAILTATFSRDGPCDDCGKHTKNGRLTCLCPFDQDDINKMDRELRRW